MSVLTPGSHVSVCVLSEGFLAFLTDTESEFRESLFLPQHSLEALKLLSPGSFTCSMKEHLSMEIKQ